MTGLVFKMQKNGNGCRIGWLKDHIVSAQLSEEADLAFMLTRKTLGMKNRRWTKLTVSPESDILPAAGTNSLEHHGTSESLAKAMLGDRAHRFSNIQSPFNMPMLPPETMAQNDAHVTRTGNVNYGQQQASVTLPRSAFDYFHLPSPANTHLIVQGTSTLSALLTNANIMQIRCTPPYPQAVPIYSPAIPLATLRPTELQLRLPHFPYIDLLPFPSMRDKLLKSKECIDRDEIWSDLTTGGFSVWGKTPWSSKGWEVTADFAKKWWWLMTEEVLDEANFWRMQRGEEVLDVRPAQKDLRYSAESINFLRRCVVRPS